MQNRYFSTTDNPVCVLQGLHNLKEFAIQQ